MFLRVKSLGLKGNELLLVGKGGEEEIENHEEREMGEKKKMKRKKRKRCGRERK